MYKDVLNHATLTHFAEWGLVIFVVVFLSVTVWALTRPKRQVKHWASLALDDADAPQQPTAPQTSPAAKGRDQDD